MTVSKSDHKGQKVGSGLIPGNLCFFPQIVGIILPLTMHECSVVSSSFVSLWTVALPGSSVHGIFQARMLERVAISFSRGSSQPRDHTLFSCIAVGFLSTESSGKPMLSDFKAERALHLEAKC